MSSLTQLQVLIVAFQNLNLLGLSGPAEVFANYALGGKAAKVTVAASSEIITSFEGVSIRRDVPLHLSLTYKRPCLNPRPLFYP
ncbi:hypothetical protein CBER1_11966 [Cercospora berteroae]|uniref:Uncharacterized protein n=1 Tax=Cercospora berteroae TaxID=357750 RepID=A0A2S6CLC3_9PEZI|nr:hypothetical protein CBER1_11966 [Cercospora berteroae]